MAWTEAVRAIYRNGVLQPLELVDLPEGAEVWVKLQVVPQHKTGMAPSQRIAQQSPSYPVCPQPPETLKRLIGLVSIGGDALADSEALYDADCC